MFYFFLFLKLNLLFSDPQDFWILTTISAGMIGFALFAYTVTNPYSGLSCSFSSFTAATAGISNSVGAGAATTAAVKVAVPNNAGPTASQIQGKRNVRIVCGRSVCKIQYSYVYLQLLNY